MKFIYSLLLLMILTSSCSTYQATVKKHDKLNYETIRVYPEWKYKEPKGRKWITPVIGLSAGAIYGYQTEFTYEGKTYKEAENAAIWGGVGLLAGAMINGILFPKRGRRTQNFDLSQSEKWVESFSKSTGIEYTITKKELNNTLILVPKEKILAIQQEYRTLERDLNSPKPSTNFQSLQDWRRKLTGEYSILLPMEITKISNLIDEHETKVANIEVLSKSEQLNYLDNNLNSLNTLNDFKKRNNLIYTKSDFITQQKVDNLIRNKVNTILSYTLSDEKEKLNTIQINKEGIPYINSFHLEFNQNYGSLSDYEQVKEMYSAIEQKKELVINSISQEIGFEIENAQSVDQLDLIEDVYFSNISSDSKTVLTLKNKLTSRREEIIVEQKKRELARQEAERRRNERIKSEEEAKKRIIAERTARINKMRQNLRIKFESNFPTFEELHYVLQSYLELINASGKYNVEDANKFIRLVEQKGFMRRRTNNISSDDETFENSKGFTIKASAFGSFDDEHLAYVSLKIPNASNELIELYQLELTSTYRNLSKSRIDPTEIPNNKDFYVDSGRTVYNLELDESGTLIVTANRNTDAHWPIVAERVDANTLKVDPFSNYTDVVVRKGDVVNLRASGSIRLGVFSVACYPEGISGFRYNNIDRNFNHGCLIGRIGGEGEWFYVGSNKTFTADATGKLQLRINDDIENDNSGYFTVRYSIE